MKVNVYILPATGDEGDINEISSKYLPQHELSIFASIPHRERRLEKIVGRVAIRALLADAIGLNPRELIITKNKYGRPLLRKNTASFQGDFNLSHTNGWIALALSSVGRVGIDLEQMKLDRPVMRIAETWFHTAEVAHLGTLEGVGKKQEFYRIWSMKEAYLKGLGLGFRDRPNHFAIGIDDSELTRGLHPRERPSSKWSFYTRTLMHDYALAVAMRQPTGEAPIVELHRLMSLKCLPNTT